MKTSFAIGLGVVTAGAALAVAAALLPSESAESPPASVAAASGGPGVTVYKSPTCGCCSAWVDHLRSNGFEVRVVDVDAASELMQLKARHGVTPNLASCHTALVDDYVIEGHVPADLVRRLLEERPAVQGLAVPGMPVGSPGMEGPRKEAYDVLTFDENGHTTVYARR